jgi:hypothetical protein
MAVAAPARRSSAPATAPPPSRTAPPRPARTAPTRRKKAPKGGATAPARRKAPARKPARRATPSRRVVAGAPPKLALVAGRAAVAVRELPDSGLVVRLTRGRAWIAVLGILLVGIVALNVVTLSFAASSSKVDERNTTLEEENSVLRGRLAQKVSTKKMRHEAAVRGLAMPTTEEPTVIKPGPHVVTEAARRLAAAG